jgi:hypothetical protein
VNVYGWCTLDSECTDNCTCAPCSNIANSEYLLHVTNTTSVNATKSELDYLDSCPSATLDEISATCASSIACTDTYSNGDTKSKTLSAGEKAGIAIGVFVFCVIIGFIVYKLTSVAYNRV